MGTPSDSPHPDLPRQRLTFPGAMVLWPNTWEHHRNPIQNNLLERFIDYVIMLYIKIYKKTL